MRKAAAWLLVPIHLQRANGHFRTRILLLIISMIVAAVGFPRPHLARRWASSTLFSAMQRKAPDNSNSPDEADRAASTPQKPRVIPRAAVSVCVRGRCRRRGRHPPPPSPPSPHTYNDYYLLVQRGKEPNRGMWSLPGGKIEYEELALQAAIRELCEETRWSDPPLVAADTPALDDEEESHRSRAWMMDHLQWYHGTVCTTDAIGEGFHYLIAHYFAEIQIDLEDSTDNDEDDAPSVRDHLPTIRGADDAADAAWYTYEQIQDLLDRHQATIGVMSVIDRVQALSRYDLLPLSSAPHFETRGG